MGTNKHKQEEETFSEKYPSSYNCIYVYNFMSLGFNLLFLLILMLGAYLKILLRLFFFYLIQQAEAIHVNPLYILIPSTLCTSFAFLLPVANPPNAIIFSYGHLKVIDMVSKMKDYQ